jgi:Ran GTPase-activating protein (RanGAP) involved in mRNA processing and transport
MYRIQNVRSTNPKINKTLYNVMIMSRTLKRLTISGCKVNIELHESLSNPMISKRSLIKKILDILLLRQKDPLGCGGDLNPKKIP